MPNHEIPDLTAETWDREVLASPVPVLVDFWAEWCGPCRMIKATLEQLAGELAGKVRFAKVNIETQPDLAARYNVRAVPTMTLFRNGQPAAQWMGAMTKPALKTKLVEFVG